MFTFEVENDGFYVKLKLYDSAGTEQQFMILTQDEAIALREKLGKLELKSYA